MFHTSTEPGNVEVCVCKAEAGHHWQALLEETHMLGVEGDQTATTAALGGQAWVRIIRVVVLHIENTTRQSPRP